MPDTVLSFFECMNLFLHNEHICTVITPKLQKDKLRSKEIISPARLGFEHTILC